MTSRTSLPNTLTSPILQRSSEGVSFRTPASGSRASPIMNGNPTNSTTSPSMYQPSYSDPLYPKPSAPMQRDLPKVENCKSPGGGSYNLVFGAVIMVIFIYLAIYIILYLSNLNMVTDLVDGERVLNTNKVLVWTLVLGTALALILYGTYRSMY